MNPTRTCTRCNKVLPATLEYFYAHPSGKFGLAPKCIKCSREYRLEHLSKMTKEQRYEMKKAEQQRNKHTYREAQRKAMALLRGVHHEDWTEKQLIETYGSDCYICHEPIDITIPRTGKKSKDSLWPDHVIPMSRGGENTIRNVRPCHRSCNESKGTKTYDEYIIYKGLK